MENRTYLVTEAEKLTGEKAHVLRYWEDELGMEIHRNSLGHRCYTAQDIQIFLGIRELKKKGRTNSTHSFHGKTASIFVKKTSRLVTFRLLPYSKSVKLICFSISFTSLPYFTAISQKIKSVFTQGEAVTEGD